MKKKIFLWIGLILLTACAPATASPLPQPTVIPPSPIPALTQTLSPATPATTGSPVFTSVPTHTPAQTVVPPAFCVDPQPVSAINSLKTSMLTSDGMTLSSLVHPTRGMDVSYFRDGNTINYTPEQAKFLFETEFVADWGLEPGSGLPKTGAFHDVVVPDLVEFFNKTYTLHCNELKVGGATYVPEFPYDGNFYSLFYAGSDEFGQMDWNTWVIGMEYVNGKPFIFALMQFFWEP